MMFSFESDKGFQAENNGKQYSAGKWRRYPAIWPGHTEQRAQQKPDN